MSAESIEQPSVGLVFKSRWFKPWQYELHVCGQVVTAAKEQRFLKSSREPSCYEWTWLDGRHCKVLFGMLSESVELAIDGATEFEIPKATWNPIAATISRKPLTFSWNRVSDSRKVIEVELTHHYLWRRYKFSDADGRYVGSFHSDDKRHCRWGKIRPMPLRDFSGDLESLLLIWAFLLARDGEEGPDYG
jgi:hypothetical protein